MPEQQAGKGIRGWLAAGPWVQVLQSLRLVVQRHALKLTLIEISVDKGKLIGMHAPLTLQQMAGSEVIGPHMQH